MLNLLDATGAPVGDFKLNIYQRNRLIEVFEERNIIVNGSKSVLASLIGGSVANNSVTQIGFGTGTNAAAATNSSLTTPFLKAFDSVAYPVAGQTQFNFSLGSTENNGMAITEFGLLTAAGVLFARKVRSTALNKASDISLTGAWTITF